MEAQEESARDTRVRLLRGNVDEARTALANAQARLRELHDASLRPLRGSEKALNGTREAFRRRELARGEVPQAEYAVFTAQGRLLRARAALGEYAPGVR